MTDLSMLPRPAAAGGAVPPGLTFGGAVPVADFTAIIKRITTTDESKLQLVLESAGLDAAVVGFPTGPKSGSEVRTPPGGSPVRWRMIATARSCSAAWPR